MTVSLMLLCKVTASLLLLCWEFEYTHNWYKVDDDGYYNKKHYRYLK